MSASDYLEEKLLEHSLGVHSYTMPTNVYMALYTATPSDTGGGTQVSGSGYARQAITFGEYSAGSIANTNEITFTASGGSFGTVVAFGIFDASTSGNLLYWSTITSTAVADGESLVFAVGQVTISAN